MPKMCPVAASDIPNPSAVNSRNVCSMPANQSTIAKLTATAAPTPGTATAVRRAAMSSGTARRSTWPRRSGGSDERGQRPLAPEDRDVREQAADRRAEDEAEAERDADDPHAARAVLRGGH